MPARRDVVIVGSGFGGSILARMLRRRGRDVLLVDRETHPRFAIGESSTPLAALALERIAAHYDLPDLASLATYGRWTRAHPELGRGLKRGFSFYAHQPGKPYENDDRNTARLLVAASPNDAAADLHWRRADVDEALARRAVAEGVELWEGASARAVRIHADRVEIEGERDGQPFRVTADAVVDATGGGGFLSRSLPIPASQSRFEVETKVVGAHFEGVRPFGPVARAGGARLDDAPYPEDRAAVHHLLEEGWMYVLPFDDGVVSAGVVTRRGEADGAFERALDRYPTLAECFRDAKRVSPLFVADPAQRRLARAAGPRFLVLPHAFAFVDPMFSTGIVWSLLGAERAAELLCRDGGVDADAAARYAETLDAEADQIGRLIGGAHRVSRRFSLFVSWSALYFALVSWSETRQRLGVEKPTALLGADREEVRELFVAARVRLDAALAKHSDAADRDFARWVADEIAPFDLIGISDASRRNLHPVDIDLLVERAPLVGMTPAAMREALPRILRSDFPSDAG